MSIEGKDIKSAGDEMYSLSAEERASMEHEDLPLPDGWIRDYDLNQEHHFYVDTKANPPRSLWVHPWEDPQWQREHPEEYQKSAVHLFEAPPPAFDDEYPHTTPAVDSKPTSVWNVAAVPDPGRSGQPSSVRALAAPTPQALPKKKSIFEKIFGTAEEREMTRRANEIREAERAQQYIMQRDQHTQNRLARRVDRAEARLDRQEDRLARRVNRTESRMDRREERLERRADRGHISLNHLERREEKIERQRDRAEHRLGLHAGRLGREQQMLATGSAMLLGGFGHAHGGYVHSGQYAPPPFAFRGRRRIGRFY